MVVDTIRLIVGLGNPGPEYANTRHNAGAWFVEQLAQQCDKPLRGEKKFHGQLSRVTIGQHDCHLLIPTTYMNRSALAIRAVLQFYQYDTRAMLVVHDELDLPCGIARLKTGGGHGGHNGLRDIIQQLGTQDFHRLRIGIGHPGHREQVLSYVLKKPAVVQKQAIDVAIAAALAVMSLVVNGNMQRAMTQLHTLEER